MVAEKAQNACIGQWYLCDTWTITQLKLNSDQGLGYFNIGGKVVLQNL